jgi:hypothetical protein
LLIVSGHRQDALDAAGRAHHRERDAGVAAGRLDDDGVRADRRPRSAASIIDTPMRSLTELAGLKNSSLRQHRCGAG